MCLKLFPELFGDDFEGTVNVLRLMTVWDYQVHFKRFTEASQSLNKPTSFQFHCIFGL